MIDSTEAKPVEQRSRQANWQRRAHAEGRCPRCGEKLDLNPHTEKPYRLGPLCRAKKAATQKALMQHRRATGQAPSD